MLECVYIELQYEKFIFLSFEIFICFGLENGCGKSFRVFDQIWRYEMGNYLGHQGKGLNTLKYTNNLYKKSWTLESQKKETLQNAGWTENSNFLIISYRSSPGKSYFRCNQGENSCFRGEYADDKNESSSVFVVKHSDRFDWDFVSDHFFIINYNFS